MSFRYEASYGTSSFLGTSDVRFSLNGTTYQNNSLVTLEDIGEDNNALFCITDLTACCSCPYTDEMGPDLGNWFFPNGTRINTRGEGTDWDFYRTRGQMVVLMQRRGGGEDGIYSCEIPDAMYITQTIYIGVYSASTGEWYTYTLVLFIILVDRHEKGILGKFVMLISFAKTETGQIFKQHAA